MWICIICAYLYIHIYVVVSKQSEIFAEFLESNNKFTSKTKSHFIHRQSVLRRWTHHTVNRNVRNRKSEFTNLSKPISSQDICLQRYLVNINYFAALKNCNKNKHIGITGATTFFILWCPTLRLLFYEFALLTPLFRPPIGIHE